MGFTVKRNWIISSSSGLIKLGIGLAFLSVFAAFTLMYLIFDHWDFWTFTSMLVLLLLPAFLGMSFLLWGIWEFRQLRNMMREDAVFAIASQKRGVITVADLALRMGIRVNDAEKLLHNLQEKGIATVGANEEGAVCFTIHDLKTAAK